MRIGASGNAKSVTPEHGGKLRTVVQPAIEDTRQFAKSQRLLFVGRFRYRSRHLAAETDGSAQPNLSAVGAAMSHLRKRSIESVGWYESAVEIPYTKNTAHRPSGVAKGGISRV